MAMVKDADKMNALWDVIDFNDNGKVSLAEIDKAVVERYPLLDHKPALMRAYKQTCLKDGGDGDAWIEPHEFPQLLTNLFYFNRLFAAFEVIDTDHDRRVDFEEFFAGLDKISMALSREEAQEVFDRMDSNHGGVVLFDEFCVWYTKKVNPEREIADCTSKFKSERRVKRAASIRMRDDMPGLDKCKRFNSLEAEFMAMVKDADKMNALWDVIDFNDNGKVSLAEIDKAVVERYPLLDHKPALMRAYKQTCLKDGGDGDAWIEPHEFPQLLTNLFYFNRLFAAFEVIDTDHDRRVDFEEFFAGLDKISMALSREEAQE